MSPEMEAGRELDALVAEKVMGWQITHRGRRVQAPDGKAYAGFTGKSDASRFIGQMSPHYSTDIAAAWEVLEKLAAEHTGINVAFGWARGWYCDLMKASERGNADAPTAPHAICLAALKAVEREASAG